MSDALTRTAAIVAAYVARNSVPASEVPALLRAIHAAFTALEAPPTPVPAKLTPPIPIRKTVTPDRIISLEDGRGYKSLKRHLSSRGLTPEAYRTKWGLPADYPMVAASYSGERSEMAKRNRLGRRTR